MPIQRFSYYAIIVLTMLLGIFFAQRLTNGDYIEAFFDAIFIAYGSFMIVCHREIA